MNEKISALLDAELGRHELETTLGALDRNADLRGVWERYHLMRAAIRNELDVMVSPGLADRIADRIKQEVPPVSPRFRPSQFMTKSAAGLALAASIAAVSIYSVRLVWPEAPGAPLTASAETGQGVLASAANKAPRRGMHWKTPQPEMEHSLNAFLVQHSEYAPTSGMGVMPYVRIVGYDNAKE